MLISTGFRGKDAESVEIFPAFFFFRLVGELGQGCILKEEVK